MTHCFCDTCPHGTPSPLWAATHCLPAKLAGRTDAAMRGQAEAAQAPSQPADWQEAPRFPSLYLKASA